MERIWLSDESYAILKDSFSSSSFSPDEIRQFPEPCIDQLLSFKLIQSKIVDYDISGTNAKPVFSDYSITELGKGYLAGRFHEEEYLRSLQSLSESVQRQANLAEHSVQAAQYQAADAEKSAKSSRASSWVSAFTAILAVLVNIAIALMNKYC